MRETMKKMFLVPTLFSTFVCLGFLSTNIAHANENPPTTEAQTQAKAEEEAKKNSENTGDVAEPPSGPNVNTNTVTKEVNIQTPSSVTGQKIDGTGTVIDFSTSGSKAFYTIKDADQKVFYLIIDLDKTTNNVYFLSDINKSDLSNATKETAANPPPATQVQSAQVEAPKAEGGNGFLIAVLLLAVVGVAAYYFLVMKKKQGRKNEEDEADEEMSEDYEDDIYEDEDEDEDKQVNKEHQ